MAWTSPKTWTATVVSVADLNAHIRDNETILKTSINDDGTIRNLFDKNVTTTDVTNTAVETTVYSFSVPGGTLSTSNALRFTMTGYIDMTASVTGTVRIRFGGTQLWAGNIVTAATTKGPMEMVATINANNATNSQRSVVRMTSVADGTNATDGNNLVLVTDGGAHSSLALDSTTAQTLSVTFTWASANANVHMKMFSGLLEVLR